jgi:ketosteroid isomerase-like protein
MQATQSRIDWLESYYAAMDSLQFDKVAEFLDEKCHNFYATGHELVGRDQILARGERNLGLLERIRHSVRNVWEEGDELIFELAVTYWRRDGQTIERPGMGIFVLKDGRIAQQRLFVDANGVWD